MSASSASSASATVNVGRTLLFKIGWIVLLLSATLITLSHFGLIFFLSEPDLFVGWTAFNLYSLLVIAIPFRGLEKWAWFATWILPVGLAAVAGTDGEIGPYFYAMSVVCVLGLLLTMRDFFADDRQVPHRVS